MINKEKYLDLIKNLKTEAETRRAWQAGLPDDIYEMFVDNIYASSLGYTNDMLLDLLLDDDDLLEDTYWFMYEWSPADSCTIPPCDPTAKILSENDFFDYVDQVYFD